MINVGRSYDPFTEGGQKKDRGIKTIKKFLALSVLFLTSVALFLKEKPNYL